MDKIWLILFFVVLLAGALYTVHTLRYGYLPFEQTYENIVDFIQKKKEKRR